MPGRGATGEQLRELHGGGQLRTGANGVHLGVPGADFQRRPKTF
jgi:hypothetical protein